MALTALKFAALVMMIRLIAIASLYTPAIILLAHNSLRAHTPPEKLLALAMLLFCMELARMAWVDLNNVALIRQQPSLLEVQNSLLKVFRIVVISTIVLELLGFYTTYFSLQQGAIIVICSQLWFNLLAGIQLCPQQPNPQTNSVELNLVEPFGITQRLPVLTANALSLLLLSLWMFESARLWLAAGLLGLIILFLLIKYVPPLIRALRDIGRDIGT